MTIVLLCLVPRAPAQSPNAWQITDQSASAGLNYTKDLSTADRLTANDSGFDFTVDARFVTDLGGTKTMAMAYGLGSKRFLIWFYLNANNDLIADLDGAGTYTVTTSGTGTALYHTQEIIYDPSKGTASYLFDGQLETSNWRATANALSAGRAYWGAGSSAGEGEMNFHSVTFSVTNSVVAAYDAGTNNNATNAPDPVMQGWAQTPSVPSPGTGVNEILSDSSLLPVAVTLDADQLAANSAALNGQVNPNGSSTVAWFEWGTDTNYGNATALQDVGQTANLSNLSALVSGLAGGPEYHYRLVASNAFGVVKGIDQSFNLDFVQTIIPGLPGVSYGSIAWGDYDNDGRLDLLITGNTSSGPVSQLWRNIGSGFTNVPVPGLPQVTYSSVAWGDYDNDGRLDFLLTGTTNALDTGAISQLWRNTGSGFTSVPIPGLPGVSHGSVAWGDYDNDGRLDFLLSGLTNYDRALPLSTSQLWRNTGSGFTNVPIPGLPQVTYSSVAWGDYDKDGRLDFLLTGHDRTSDVSQLWRNTGSGFTNVPIPGLPQVSYSSVAWGDYDNDGRLDFLLTGHDRTSDVSQLWRNTGSGFTNVPIPGVPQIARSSVACGDYDNDGRLDFLLTGYSSSGPVSQLWRNTGSTFTKVDTRGLPGVSIGSVAWSDYDNDGRLDFLLSGTDVSGNAIIQLWQNNLPVNIIKVTNLSDGGYGTLRQSIAQARPFDTILLATNGVIKLTNGELLITNSLTIAGSGPSNLAVSGNNAGRVFEIRGEATVGISDLTIQNGTNGEGGGVLNLGTLTLSNCVVTANAAGYRGGGIANSGTVTLNNCTLDDNSAAYVGGGIENDGTLTVNNCIFSSNFAANEGGGIDNEGDATTTLNNSTVSGNSAIGYYGGGIENYGSLMINGSTLSDNSAGYGGGIDNEGGIIALNNSTFAGNSAAYNGGAVANSGTLTLNNSTLDGNSAAYVGGGIYQDTGTSALTNTIVAGNSALGSPNLSGSYSGASNFIDGNPLLASLGDHGGPTQTMPPLAGSSAVDSGLDTVTNFLATDQRGYTRLSGVQVDIGAAERQIVTADNAPLLTNPVVQASGALAFSFAGSPDASFTVLASTNLVLPSAQWTVLGPPVQNPPGQFQFTDPGAAHYPERFYQVVSP